MSTVIKNKKAYDSADLKCSINGVPINITELSYDIEQEHQLNHTLDPDATSWSLGKKTPSGTLGLMMEDVVKLEDVADGDLLSLKPFEINATFTNDYNKIVNDTIVCKFQNQGREVTGDMGLQKQYTLFVMGISFNNS